jgi:vacuolar protein sorting-associated protein 13D
MVKRRLGLTLIRFEEALVELDPFFKQHPFETFDFLLASLVKHYRDELLSQALLVLGSVDFLGNPVGFVNDVSVGVSGLIHEGSVGLVLCGCVIFDDLEDRFKMLMFVTFHL